MNLLESTERSVRTGFGVSIWGGAMAAMVVLFEIVCIINHWLRLLSCMPPGMPNAWTQVNAMLGHHLASDINNTVTHVLHYSSLFFHMLMIVDAAATLRIIVPSIVIHQFFSDLTPDPLSWVTFFPAFARFAASMRPSALASGQRLRQHFVSSRRCRRTLWRPMWLDFGSCAGHGTDMTSIWWRYG